MRHRYLKCSEQKDVRKCPKESVMCRHCKLFNSFKNTFYFTFLFRFLCKKTHLTSVKVLGVLGHKNNTHEKVKKNYLVNFYN